MDLDKYIEYLFVTDQLDNNFNIKEKCPKCKNDLMKVDDNAYPFFCPKCNIFFNKKKTKGIINTK